ncbi:universal stress protein [Natrarchaeobius halalkaliphilus]|uniref:Universal stress protein n=1 Tax=Natrarchaeobius halalkaliphilus TaxID=1679091 RepID=A0A3N6LUN2_9EURY|nr:universal stress protein [Natrarchaeobius halalkaliphilus]RQG91274.1 universal stress protein [Natrarchaeobius halalkaliphilus]
MYQDLLLATDGSDGAQRATDHAIALANRLDARVHVLSVAEEGPHSTEQRDRLRADPESEAIEAVEKADTAATTGGVETTTTVRSGVPQEQIVDVAEANEIDMIVIGAVGRGKLEQLVVGSVAQEVVRTASVPVVTVRDGS